MGVDPNEELIGYEFAVEDGKGVVTGTALWSKQEYVTVAVRRDNGSHYVTARLASLVRRHLQQT